MIKRLSICLPQFGHGFGLIHKHGTGGGVVPLKTMFQFFGGRNWFIGLVRLDHVELQAEWQQDQS